MNSKNQVIYENNFTNDKGASHSAPTVDLSVPVVIPIQIMFATHKFFVRARHPQYFGVYNYLAGAVPLPICPILFSKWYNFDVGNLLRYLKLFFSAPLRLCVRQIHILIQQRRIIRNRMKFRLTIALIKQIFYIHC